MSVGELLLARHAAVLADVEAGRLGVAARALPALVRRAERVGCGDLVPRFRLTWAWVELDRGRLAACGRQLELAGSSPYAVDRARGACLAALTRCAAGDHVAAVDRLTPAIVALRRLGDRRWTANALVGRGTANGYLHRLREADADFAAAGGLYAALGERVRAAACVHNRGFVAAQAGDLPLALRYFDDAEAGGLPVDRHPEVLIDRAQVLVAAGMARAARPVVARAAALLAAAGRGTKLAEATLAVAQCAWRAGQPMVAAEVARRAVEMFGRQGRTSWRPAARAVELMASHAGAAGDQHDWGSSTAQRAGADCDRHSCGPSAAQRIGAVGDRRGWGSVAVRRVAADCDRHGWWLAAAELRLVTGVGLPDVADRRHCGPAALRALGWLARARLATDRRGVLAACRAGLRVVRRDAATVAAWELRAGVAGHTAELAECGLRAALAGGRARTVLRWVDECRDVAGPAVLPPADAELARLLVALRAAVADGASIATVKRLEHRVRTREWLATGSSAGSVAWDFDKLAERLGAAALVSFGCVDGQSIAVSVVDGRCRLHRLGRTTVVDAAVRSLRFAAAVAVGRPSPAVVRSAREVDSLLLGEMQRVVGDRDLVVVPAGGGHAVPWGALPSCVGRSVSVVPSVAVLSRPRATGNGDAVWVAGPRLRYAGQEVRALHAAHGGQVLSGRRATVAAALAAMDGAGLVHIAAHGRFRDDQPLFSAVELADGPLYAYDVQRLRRAPQLVVLSACDAGRSVVRGGDVLGLATALLRAGTSTVVASVLPVPDRRAVGLVTALHAGMRDGRGPAAALAAAQVEHGDLGFVCFGAE